MPFVAYTMPSGSLATSASPMRSSSSVPARRQGELLKPHHEERTPQTNASATITTFDNVLPVTTTNEGATRSLESFVPTATAASTARRRDSANSSVSNATELVHQKRRHARSSVLVDLSNCRYDIVRFAFSEMLGFRVLAFNTVSPSSGVASVLPGCDVYWSDRTLAPVRVHNLLLSKCIAANHFPGIELLCRKISMAKLLTTMHSFFPAEYDFFPRTFTSYDNFCSSQALKTPTPLTESIETDPSLRCSTTVTIPEGRQTSCEATSTATYYICKPNGGCCGKDIVITNYVTQWAFDGVVRHARTTDGELASGNYGEVDPCVVQEYIDRPLLVNGRKCDLRCYVLVSSIDPLVIYFYEEGIVRLCASDYRAPEASNVHNLSIHLANYAVNKKNKQVTSFQARSNVDSPLSDSSVGGLSHTEELYISALDGGAQGTSLKQTFSFYRRYLLHYVQRCPALLQKAEELYARENGRRYHSSVPHVILATHLIDRLWSSIHGIVIKSIMASVKQLREQCPAQRCRVMETFAGARSGFLGRSASASASAQRGFPTSVQHSSGSAKSSVEQIALVSSAANSTHQHNSGKNSCFAQMAAAASATSRFFEVLGFDILVDEALKPWLIEINHSPSWATDTVFDFDVKGRVLTDALHICVASKFPSLTKSSCPRQPTPGPASPARSRQNHHQQQQEHLWSNPRPTKECSAANVADDGAKRFVDEEYDLEGNRFQLIFPSEQAQESLSEVMQQQCIRAL